MLRRAQASSSSAAAGRSTIPRLAGLRCTSWPSARGNSPASIGGADDRRPIVRVQATSGGGGVGDEDNSNKPQPSLMDGLLDGMMAGRKLRRWYGQSDEPMLPQQRQQQQQDETAIADAANAAAADLPLAADDSDDDQTPRTAVLVTGADTPTGELVVLQLLLAGSPSIRAVVSDVAAARAAYGEHVEAVERPSGAAGPAGAAAAQRLLRGVAAVAVAGPLPGSLLDACASTRGGVRRLVVPSTVGAAKAGGGGLAAALFGGGGGGAAAAADDAALADAARERAARDAVNGGAVPSVAVVRAAGGVRDAPGAGLQGLSVSLGGAGGGGDGAAGPISREDLALVVARLCVEAAVEDEKSGDEQGVLEVVVRPAAAAARAREAAAV